MGSESGEFAQGSVEVNQFTERVGDSAAFDVGAGDDQRHPQAGLIGGTLSIEPVVAEEFAVVGGENDIGVVELAAFFERGQNKADLVVDQFDGGAILAAGLCDFFRR